MKKVKGKKEKSRTALVYREDLRQATRKKN